MHVRKLATQVRKDKGIERRNALNKKTVEMLELVFPEGVPREVRGSKESDKARKNTANLFSDINQFRPPRVFRGLDKGVWNRLWPDHQSTFRNVRITGRNNHAENIYHDHT